jgi:Zn-dependent protease
LKIGRIELGPGFVLIWALLFFFDDGGWVFYTAIAIAVHEAGHWAALRLFGKRVECLRFHIAGLTMEPSAYPVVSYKAELLITLAGPVAGFILTVIAALMEQHKLAGVSAALTIVNLLPAETLDGGRALYITAQWLAGERAAGTVRLIGTLLCLLMLLAGGVWAAIRTQGRNITLLAMALPAVFACFRMKKKV